MPFIIEQRANRLPKYKRIIAHGTPNALEPRHINNAIISGSVSPAGSVVGGPVVNITYSVTIPSGALQNVPIDIVTIPSNCLSILSSSSTTNALVTGATDLHVGLASMPSTVATNLGNAVVTGYATPSTVTESLVSSVTNKYLTVTPIGGDTTNSTTFTVTLLVSCI